MIVRAVTLLLVAWLTLGAAARAQTGDVEVTAQVSAQRVFVGQAVTLQISVDGADGATVPEILEIDGFGASYSGANRRSSSHTTFDSTGRRVVQQSHGVDYVWRLVPQREGTIEITPIDVVVEGVTYTTPTIPIQVVPPQEDPDIRFFVEASDSSPFVGEPIRVKISLAWNLRQVESIRAMPTFTFPALKGPFSVAPLSPPPRGRDQTIVVLGQPIGFQVLDTRIDGERWEMLEAEFALIPRRAGEFDMAPVTASGVKSLRHGGNFFNRPTQRFSVPSGSITLDVRPLPTKDAPSAFSGLVGRYSIRAEATPTDVNVGDPIELTIRIRGPLPSIVELPSLERQNDLISRFRIGSEEKPPRANANEKIFTRTIRALSDDLSEIPPIELAYFDVESSQYEVARSDAIPLVVRPTRVVTTSDAEGAALPEGANASPIEEMAGGIRHNIAPARALVDQSFTLGTALSSPLALGTLALPPIVYASAAVIVVARRRASRDESGRRRRLAAPRAREALRDAPDESSIGAALRQYIADRLGRAEAGLTSTQGASLIEDCVGDELSDRAASILARCDEAIYAGGSASDLDSLRANARELLDDLERALRRARA